VIEGITFGTNLEIHCKGLC